MRHVSRPSFAIIALTSAGLLAAACLLAAPAGAAVLVWGNSKAHECFLYAKSGVEPREGIEVCNEALDDGQMSAKDNAATLVNRGVLLDQVGRYEEAFEDFNHGISRNPDLGDGYLNRGAALIRLKRYDDALADVQKGMSLGVTEPVIGYYDRAVAEEYLGRLRDAYFDYKHALEILPGYAPAAEALNHFVVTRVPASPRGGT